MKNNKGVTLVELLIVLVIIGVLSMIGVPAYMGQQANATRAEAYQNLTSLRLLEEQLFSETADYADKVKAVGVDEIKALLPGFKPGNDLKFTYVLNKNMELTSTDPIATAATGVGIPCFVAAAIGKTKTRVDGETYAIDCNNNRNF